MCSCMLAAVGRRGWKMFYAALCDMTLYMYSDENSYKRSTHCANVIHLHHSLAAKAGDYVKKNHVFRLQTADMAQYLIQTRSFSSYDILYYYYGWWRDSPCPPIDSIMRLMTLWRITRKIIRPAITVTYAQL